MIDVETSLADLEREVLSCRRAVRRDRLVVGGLAALVAFLIVGGTGQAEKKMMDELRAKKLAIIDEKGKERARLGVTADGSPGLDLTDSNGRSRANLKLRKDGSPALYLRDEKSHLCVVAEVMVDGTPVLSLSDEKGVVRATLLLEGGLPTLALFDENRKMRAVVGAANAVSPDGTKINYPESSLVLYGPDGAVIGKLP